MVRLIARFICLQFLLMGQADAAPVVVYIVAAIQAMTVAQMVMAALTAFSFFSSIAAKRKARKDAANARADYLASMTDRRITVLSELSPHQVIYGAPAPLGGSIEAVLHSGEHEQFKHIVIAFAAHECEAIDDILIDNVSVFPLDADGWSKSKDFCDWDDDGTSDKDDESVNLLEKFAPRVNVQIHLSPAGVDTADAFLKQACPEKWTEAHKLSGYTYIVLTIDQRLSRFQGGMPNVTAKVRGKKVLDPRTGLTAYSRNPALCVTDFIASRAGFLAQWDQFQIDTVIASANACGDGEGAIYAVDGAFKTNQDRDVTRQQLEDAMAGTTLESGGVWVVLAGAWTTPVMHLGDEDMLAPIVVTQTCHTGTERFNGARGTYIKASGDGTTTDFTPYSHAEWLANDGKQKHADIALPFVGNQTQCTQLARIKVEKSRGGLTLKIAPKMRGWRLQPGDRITLTSSILEFQNKSFRVVDWTFSASAPLALEIIEDEESFYDQVDSQAEDPAPNVNLPSPFIAPPAPTMFRAESGPAWMVQQGDVLVPRVLFAWEQAMRVDVLRSGRVQLRWRQTGSADAWQTAEVSGADTTAFGLGLQTGGTYDIHGRFVTAYATGAWATTVHTVLGLIDAPSSVHSLALALTDAGVRATWGAPSAVDQLAWAYTEVRRGPTWATGAVAYSGKGTDALLPFMPAGNNLLWATHVNTLGDESVPVVAALLIQAPSQPVVTAQVQGKQVQLKWGDCRTTQPLDAYRVSVGATLATAQLVGHVAGTTMSVMEAQAGKRIYWVVAYDKGGNPSAAGYIEVTSLPGIDEGMAALQEGLGDVSQLLYGDAVDKPALEQPLVPLAARHSTLLSRVMQESDATGEELLRSVLAWGELRKLVTDAGIVTDPATGQVSIFGVQATADQISVLTVKLNQMAGTLALKATTAYVNQTVNNAIAEAQLGEADLLLFRELTGRVSEVEVTLDSVEGQLQNKATTAQFEAHAVRLQTAEQRLSAQQGLLEQKVSSSVYEQGIGQITNRLATAEETLEAVGDAATLRSTVVAARRTALQQDSDAETTVRTLLGMFEQGKALRHEAAAASTELSADFKAGISAEAKRIDELAAEMVAGDTALKATVQTATSALVQADAAQVKRMDQLIATVDGDRANVAAWQTNEVDLRSAGDSANASVTSLLGVKVGEHTAKFTQQATVNATLADRISATVSNTIDVNGHVSGTINNNNGITSAFVVVADRFAAALPGSANELIYPFIVGSVNGVPTVGVNGELLVDGSVNARAVYTPYLSAHSANLGDVMAGRIRNPANSVFFDLDANGTQEVLHLGNDLSYSHTGGLQLKKLGLIDTGNLVVNAVTVPQAAVNRESLTIGNAYSTVQSLDVQASLGNTFLFFGAAFRFLGYASEQQVLCRVMKGTTVLVDELEVHFSETESTTLTTTQGGLHAHSGSTSVSGSTGSGGNHSHSTNGSVQSGGNPIHTHSFIGGTSGAAGDHSHSFSATANINLGQGGMHDHFINIVLRTRTAGTMSLTLSDTTRVDGVYQLQLRAAAGGDVAVGHRYIQANTFKR